MQRNKLVDIAEKRGVSPLDLVIAALRENGGSAARAAAALGVTETTIRYWMNGRIRVTRRTVVDIELVTQQ
jgi:DNA-binding transcriptional regulator YdaS (Cro superfamily)